MQGWMTALQRGLAAWMAVLMLTVAAPATAEDVVDAEGIRAAIEEQLAAFQRDDLVTAFRYATPKIQTRFQTPTRFGLMVQHGYPMIRKPRQYDIGAINQTPAGPIQIVTFVDGEGIAWEAEYQMRLVDGRWRIAGVMLKRLPGFAT